MAYKNIHIIINPASGKDEPILNVLNDVFQQYDIDWQIYVTKELGDAGRFAEEAVAAGADLVVGYGGDGTVMEIANVLHGRGLPMGILPGGTSNSVAREVGLPFKLAEAAELLCQPSRLKEIDICRIGDDEYFLLHVYIGVTPEQLAGREWKDKAGILAYLLPVVRVIKEPQMTRYFLTVDDEEMEEEGIVCVLINAFGWGIEPPLDEPVSSNDGLLDLFVIKKNVPEAVGSLLTRKEKGEIILHKQGRKISVRSETPQNIWTDGEDGGQTPFTAVIDPNPFRIVVPYEKE
jgi:diacylglycerol kinase (ATP)